MTLSSSVQLNRKHKTTYKRQVSDTAQNHKGVDEGVRFHFKLYLKFVHHTAVTIETVTCLQQPIEKVYIGQVKFKI